MSDFERFEHLFQNVQQGKANSGRYDSLLSDVDRALLDEFVVWLRKAGLTDASSSSYRSYMAKAIAKPELKLTNDQRSAVRKFQAFLNDR
jgi:hypothetical protein